MSIISEKICIISYTLGTQYLMSVSGGEWGMLQKAPVSADNNQLIYDQAAVGMAYLDCNNQTLSLLDFKIKDHSGNIVNLHSNHASSV